MHLKPYFPRLWDRWTRFYCPSSACTCLRRGAWGRAGSREGRSPTQEMVRVKRNSQHRRAGQNLLHCGPNLQITQFSPWLAVCSSEDFFQGKAFTIIKKHTCLDFVQRTFFKPSNFSLIQHQNMHSVNLFQSLCNSVSQKRLLGRLRCNTMNKQYRKSHIHSV